MSCIFEEGQCTKCCEAIHVTHKAAWLIIHNHTIITDGEKLRKNWVSISKRRAKKINPYMFQTNWDKQARDFINKEASFFKCKRVSASGCSIYQERPKTCKDFIGGGLYRDNCRGDIIATDKIM